MSSLKSFFKDTVIYGMASVLPRLISIALVPVFTKVLILAEFSDQTTWYVYAAFINVLLTMGLETAFFRFYTSEVDKDKVISTAFLMMMGSSFIFAIAGTLSAPFVCNFLGFKDPLFIQILVLTTVLDTLVVIPFAYLRVSGRPIKFMIIKVANVLCWFALTAMFLLVLPELIPKSDFLMNTIGFGTSYKPGVMHIIIANLFASLFTLFCLAPEMLKIKWAVDKLLVIKFINYGLPIMIAGIAYAINENMDKLVIQRLIDKDANGMYAACYKLGVFMTLYITAFRMGAEPFFFNHAASPNAKEKYSKIMTWFVIFGCLFLVFVVGFIDVLAGLFIKNEAYLPGLMIVPIILVANLFSGIYNNLAIWYKLTDRTYIGMYISILGALLTIILLFVLIPVFGIMGGAIATFLTYFIMTLVSYSLGHKYYHVSYEIKKIAAYIIISCIFCYISFILFRGNYFVSIIGLGLFLIIVAIIEKLNIRKIVRFDPF
ncbi:MAG: polysaccharide biosynthesis protein [Saprospiraceae bacterium]|nr:polysaccharide biosynthesis protein [Saprospiraceae bacterium]